jgi:hypothetical protein
MKARIIGIEIAKNTPVTVETLLAWLGGQPKETKYSKAKRLLYLEEDSGHVFGLLLTTKSHKKACELVSNNGTLKIAVTSVADNSERIDFNFLVLRLSTQKGLYLQYKGSWNIHSFGNFIHTRYVDFVRSEREKAVLAAGVPNSGKKAKEIRKKYAKPKLDCRIIVREQRLAELLNRLNKIGSFEFPLTTLTMRSRWFTPLKDATRVEEHVIRFRSDVTKRSLIAGIVKTIQKAGITRGKVYGKNEAGFDDYVDLVENPDVFESFDFDDIADEQNLDLSNIRSSALLRRMREVLDEHAHIFDEPIK